MKSMLKGACAGLCLVLVTGCGPAFEDKPAAKVEPAETTAASQQPASQPASLPAGETLVLDTARSRVEFVGAKVTGKHDGGFKGIEGEAVVADGQAQSVSLTIDMSSLWSDNEKLTGHLKSPDFFEVESYPQSSFSSTGIEAGGEGDATHTITGELTMRGVTKTISFPATVTVGEGGASGNAEFSINRQEFGISYPGRPDDLIKDEVLLKLELYFS